MLAKKLKASAFIIIITFLKKHNKVKLSLSAKKVYNKYSYFLKKAIV